jgi:sugar phosphate isomerase/epimerase
MNLGEGVHLTYCTNIHPGETWAEVRRNLEYYVPRVRDGFAPAERFGIGLRLSYAAARALRNTEAMAEFKAFLEANDFYIFTLNGFPYGRFHDTPVKADVYLPDWQSEDRLGYTDLLAELLAELLPADLEGSISTVPGAFKPVAKVPGAQVRMTDLMVRHVAHLVRLHERTGRLIGLALEPEPCCLLETVDETVNFFKHRLFGEQAVARLMGFTGLAHEAAQAALRRHLGVCLDLCHAAVEFEDPRACLAQLREAGIRVLKLQLSAGLIVPGVDARTVDLLRPFDDQVYLHQVVERSAIGLQRYVDLPDAFAALDGRTDEREWRVHFHVPVFLDDLGAFRSTSAFIRETLALHREQPISAHLEAETYTFGVLPAQLRSDPVDRAIVRELSWLREQLQA